MQQCQQNIVCDIYATSSLKAGGKRVVWNWWCYGTTEWLDIIQMFLFKDDMRIEMLPLLETYAISCIPVPALTFFSKLINSNIVRQPNKEQKELLCQLRQPTNIHTAFVPHSWVLPNRQHSRTTACALDQADLMSDRGYLLIQAFFLLGICL